MSIGISTITTHAPWVNLVMASTIVATPVATAPVRLIASALRHPLHFESSQCQTIPACERVKEMKTPTAYSGIKA